MKAFADWRATIIICLSVVLVGGIDQKTLNALKVRHILRKIETHQTHPGSPDLMAVVTEAELNDYIDHRLAKEKNLAINKVKIALLDNNSVKGKLNADGDRLHMSILFGEQLDFDFKGVLYTQKGAARIDLKDLKLNGQTIAVQVLDTIIRSAAMLNGAEPVGINDWHALPKGIKRIRLHKGPAVLYY